MKSIRSIVNLITIALALGLSFICCKQKDSEQNDGKVSQETVEKNSDSTSQNVKITQDSVNINPDSIRKQIDSLKVNLKAESKEITQFSSDISEIKGKLHNLKDNTIWIWCSLGLSIIALILVVLILRICIIRNNKISRHKENFKQIFDRLNNIDISLQKINSNPVSVTSPIIQSENSSILVRLNALEKHVQELLSAKIIYKPQPLPPNGLGPVERSESGYFSTPISGSNSAPYFKEVFTSRNGDERFSVKVKGEQATFEPINENGYLNSYFSVDALRAVIEFDGCTPGSANNMKIIESGKAELQGEKWIVTKKAKIKLS